MHSNIEIEDILSKLPLNQRIVLKERFINQKSYIEIANELGVTRQAINRSKNRGLKNLNKYLKIYNKIMLLYIYYSLFNMKKYMYIISYID